MPRFPFLHQALAVLLVWSAGGAACAGDAVVTLMSPVTTSARVFTLGEIAKIDATDAATVEELRQLQVGQIDVVGRDLLLTRAEIARYVRRHLPQGIDSVQWQGVEASTVRMTTVRLEPQVVLEQAMKPLREHLEAGYADVELRATSRLDVLRVPAGEITFSAKVAGTGGAQKRMRVDVELRSGSEIFRTVAVWFDVHAYTTGWTLTRPIATGQILQAGDVELQRIDVAQLSSRAIPVSLDVVGKRLRRTSDAGTALTDSLLDSAPLVARQDEVVIEVRSGDVVIESRGTAMSEGRSGDWVSVRVTDTDLLRGRVVGPKRLALTF